MFLALLLSGVGVITTCHATIRASMHMYKHILQVAQEINYAKSLHDEQKHMVDIPAGHSAEIW